MGRIRENSKTTKMIVKRPFRQDFVKIHYRSRFWLISRSPIGSEQEIYFIQSRFSLKISAQVCDWKRLKWTCRLNNLIRKSMYSIFEHKFYLRRINEQNCHNLKTLVLYKSNSALKPIKLNDWTQGSLVNTL